MRSDLTGWHHGALVRRGSSFERWLDGVGSETRLAGGSFVDPTASPTYLGVGRCVRGAPGDDGTSDTRPGDRGASDEVAFYERALSAGALTAWAGGGCAP